MGALTKDEAQKARTGSRRAAYQEVVTHQDTPEADSNAEARVDESDNESEDEGDDGPESVAFRPPSKPARAGVSLAVYKVGSAVLVVFFFLIQTSSDESSSTCEVLPSAAALGSS